MSTPDDLKLKRIGQAMSSDDKNNAEIMTDDEAHLLRAAYACLDKFVVADGFAERYGSSCGYFPSVVMRRVLGIRHIGELQAKDPVVRRKLSMLASPHGAVWVRLRLKQLGYSHGPDGMWRRDLMAATVMG